MVWEGKTNPEIAGVLGSTEQVVKNQLRGIFDKLGVWSRLELALYVASHGGARWAADLGPTEKESASAATRVGGTAGQQFIDCGEGESQNHWHGLHG